MELMQEVKDYSQEELEEDEEEIMTKTTREEEESSSKQQLQHCTFSSPPSNFSLSSSSPSTTHHHNHNHDVTNVSHQQNQWLGMNHHHHHSPESHNSAASKGGLGLLHQHQHQDATTSNFTNLKQIDFMELSLGNNNNNNKNKDVVINDPVPQEQEQQPSTHEKEHMFDKVVTPSDVGKLNRLVIPKQHAEKYFPLDSTSNEKGLLLNFEDRNGKLWRFRYSYWNSSQSYVMTKGWSRFVKEKKLDAGDIVSFQRGVGELFRHRLFIDWRRRSNHNHHTIDPSSATLFTPFFLPNQQQYSIRWGGANSRFYSLPYPTPQRLQHQQQNHHDPLHNQMNFNHNMFPFHQYGGGNVNHQYNFHHHDPSSVFYMRSLAPSSMSMPQGSLSTRSQQQEGGVGGSNVSNMIIDSVPVSHYHHHHGNLTSNATTSTTTNGAAKRLRLFGVNMECGGSSTSDDNLASPSSIVPSLQHLKVPHHEETLSSSTSTRFEEDKRREEASMIFGLDTSLQYHNYQQQ